MAVQKRAPRAGRPASCERCPDGVNLIALDTRFISHSLDGIRSPAAERRPRVVCEWKWALQAFRAVQWFTESAHDQVSRRDYRQTPACQSRLALRPCFRVVLFHVRGMRIPEGARNVFSASRMSHGDRNRPLMLCPLPAADHAPPRRGLVASAPATRVETGRFDRPVRSRHHRLTCRWSPRPAATSCRSERIPDTGRVPCGTFG